MKSGWTVALVIAASLSAQSAVAADARTSDTQLASLLRLLAGTSRMASDAVIADGQYFAPVSTGIDHCTETSFGNSLYQVGCPQTMRINASPAGSSPDEMLLKFVIEVRGP